MGFKEQPVFVNCAVLVETELKPLKLLKITKKIEKEMGRVKTFKYGPRKIDIDILLCEGLTINFKKLKIPHKDFLKRSFELLPSLEVAPNFVHPFFKKSLEEIAKDITFKKKAIKSIKPNIILTY